jgi:hypothetical protein
MFKYLKTHPVVEIRGLAINQFVMNVELEQSLKLFKSGNPEIARQRFKGALSLCVSCHIESLGASKKTSEAYKIFPDIELTRMKISDFEKAELAFVTRDFKLAIQYYDKFLIDSAKIKQSDEKAVLSALKNELIYFVDIEKDFPKGVKHFEAFLELNIFEKDIKNLLTDWIKSLSGRRLETFFGSTYDPQKISELEMSKFIQTFQRDPEGAPIYSPPSSYIIYDLNMSTLLLDFMKYHPETSLGAQIYYWLAVMDQRTNSHFLFPLRNNYLLVCIEKFSNDPFAQKCIQSYNAARIYPDKRFDNLSQ